MTAPDDDPTAQFTCADCGQAEGTIPSNPGWLCTGCAHS